MTKEVIFNEIPALITGHLLGQEGLHHFLCALVTAANLFQLQVLVAPVFGQSADLQGIVDADKDLQILSAAYLITCQAEDFRNTGFFFPPMVAGT